MVTGSDNVGQHWLWDETGSCWPVHDTAQPSSPITASFISFIPL